MVAGAGLAFAHTVTGATAGGPVLAASTTGHSLADTAAPAPVTTREASNTILPFNAKLTS